MFFQSFFLIITFWFVFNHEVFLRLESFRTECDLGESFPTNIWLQISASIQPRTSLVKLARSPYTILFVNYRFSRLISFIALVHLWQLDEICLLVHSKLWMSGLLLIQFDECVEMCWWSRRVFWDRRRGASFLARFANFNGFEVILKSNFENTQSYTLALKFRIVKLELDEITHTLDRPSRAVDYMSGCLSIF